MKKIIAFVVVSMFWALNADSVSACMCRTIGTPKSNLADSGAVFLGKVVAAKKGEWRIDVGKVWKGEVGEKALMRDPSRGTSCESRFKLGESYIFFTDVKRAGRRVIYRPRGCTWTVSLTYRYEGVLMSEGVLQELGESRPPIMRPAKEKRE